MRSGGLVHCCGPIEVDLVQRELRVHGAPVALGSRAFAIVEALLKTPGELVTKDQLLSGIWAGVAVEENTLDVHVSALRKVLGSGRALLRTVYGQGYRLVGDWTIREAGHRSELGGAGPPRSSARSTNLPHLTSELIGRAAVTVKVRELLSNYRLVTLTGLGGIGKTRLAIEVARRFEFDAWLVEFAPISDPSLVPSTLAAALDLQLGAVSPAAANVARAIGERKLLLVLDNCEHVVDAAAALAEAVIRSCPNVLILATSRESLRTDGERVYRVAPLDVPEPHLKRQDEVLGHGAVALFVERLRASDANFKLREQDVPALADICRRLDGVPLAIELAAARAGTLGIRQVLSRLDDRFELLTGGKRTALPRQQTLRATLDWSYELLPDVEKMLLRRVGVMAGGFTLGAVRAVVGEMEGTTEARGPPLLECLANLVGKALIVLDESGSSTRWWLLDTVRAYALDRLVGNGEMEDTARRHAEFFCDFFVLTDETPTAERMAVYGSEIDNVRAALDWAFSEARTTGVGVALTAAYVPYLLQLSSMVECRDRAERALSHLPVSGLSARLEAQLHVIFGLALIYTTGEVDRTRDVLRKALEIASGQKDVDLLLQALWATFIYKLNNSAHCEAQSYAERFSDLAGRAGEPEDGLMGDRMMGTTMHYAGHQAKARRYYDRYLKHYSAPRLHRHLTWLHYDGPVLVKARLSRVLWLQGLIDQAGLLADQNVRDAKALNHPRSECLAVGEAACLIAAIRGDFDAAQQHVALLSEIAGRQSLTFWLGVAKCLEGKLLMLQGNASEGVAQLRMTMDSFGAAHQSMQYAGFVLDLVEGTAATGDLTGASVLADEALTRAERSGVRWHVPELLRLKGELMLLAAGPADAAHSEACFQSASFLAEHQDALFWKLKAASSLAQLWARQERQHDAHQMLQPILAKFTEGFASAELRSASALLKELAK